MTSLYQKSVFLAWFIFGFAAFLQYCAGRGSGYGGGSGGGGGSSGGSSYGGSSSGGGGGGHAYGREPTYPPRPYNFRYDVNDHYSGSNFGQREQSDGQRVNGEYRVNLPDGRTQIVSYNADWVNGFNADVKYQGEARYPQPPAGGYGGQSSSGYGAAQPQSGHASSGHASSAGPSSTGGSYGK